MIRHISLRTALQKLLSLARRTMKNGRPASEDPVVRQKIAALSIGERVLQLNGYRSLTKNPPGRRARPGGLDLEALLEPARPGPGRVRHRGHRPPTRSSRRAARWRPTTASGSSTASWPAAAASARAPTEILRNILGERVLGPAQGLRSADDARAANDGAAAHDRPVTRLRLGGFRSGRRTPSRTGPRTGGACPCSTSRARLRP